MQENKPITPEFDALQFLKDIRSKRFIDGNMNLRTAADQIGISASTLSRLENGKVPELLTYVSVCRWLKKSIREYIKP